MRVWPFRRKAATASAGIIESIQRGDLNFVRSLGGTNQRVRAALNSVMTGGYAYQYRSSPAVRMVIDLIARNMGQLDIDLYRYRGQAERELEENHPAADSIHHPNPTMTTDQLIRTLVTDFCVYGNAFAQKGGGNGTVSIWPIPAQLVEVYGDGLVASSYVIHRVDGSYTDPIPADQFIHWKTANPEDPRIGLSPLETLKNVLAEDAANQAAILELASTGMSSPVWVYSPTEAPEISDEGRHRAEEDLHNRLQRINTFPPFMEEGRELRPFGVTPKEAETLDTRRYAVQQVAAEFGVPLAMLGFETFDAAAQTAFYTDTLQPLCSQLACELDRSILQAVYGEMDLSYAFDIDEKFIGDERIKTMISGAGAPILLRDEARARLGLGPLPDGIGQRPVIPANIMEEDGTSTGKPSVDVMPPQNPAGPDQSGAGRQGDPYTQAINGNGKAIVPPPSERVPQHLERRKNLMARNRRYIGEFEAILESHLTRQANRGRKSLDSPKWNEDLEGDVLKQIRSVFEREGSYTMGEFAGGEFDMSMVENFTAAMARDFAKKFNAQTQADAREGTLADAIDRARSQRVRTGAISLGGRAANKAREEAGHQGPFPQYRTQTWVADTDRHGDLDGTSVALGGDWGGIVPGSEPNCACGMDVS